MRGECAEQMNLQLKSQNVTHKDADEVANRGNKERREREEKGFVYLCCLQCSPACQADTLGFRLWETMCWAEWPLRCTADQACLPALPFTMLANSSILEPTEPELSFLNTLPNKLKCSKMRFCVVCFLSSDCSKLLRNNSIFHYESTNFKDID